MSASGPPTLLARPMTYSRLTKLFAYDWKVAKSPVGRETALIKLAYPDHHDHNRAGHLRHPRVGDTNSDPRPRA